MSDQSETQGERDAAWGADTEIIPRDRTDIERNVINWLSVEEAQALLWAIRHIPLEDLRSSEYHGRYDRAVGHGALSSAANRVEAALGAALNDEALEIPDHVVRTACVAAGFLCESSEHWMRTALEKVWPR